MVKIKKNLKASTDASAKVKKSKIKNGKKVVKKKNVEKVIEEIEENLLQDEVESTIKVKGSKVTNGKKAVKKKNVEKVIEETEVNKVVEETEVNKVVEESEEENLFNDAEESDIEDTEAYNSEGDDVEEHKKALERLKETDPEFYKYLQENDKKLLQFHLSDEEDSDAEDDEGKVHKPPNELEVASDESDFEPDDDTAEVRDSRVVTLKLIKQWQNDLQTDETNKTITHVIRAFHAALKHVSSEQEEDDSVEYFKVEGSTIFNAIIQICVLDLGPAIRRFLGMNNKKSKMAPHKYKRFAKVKTLLKDYFTDLLKLLGSVSSTNILNVLLKHLHYMSPLLVSYTHTTKHLLKKIIDLWAKGEDSVRVVAFLCILRITHNQQRTLLNTVLKAMYLNYVKNSKFVSVNTLPGINFMRRSLVEIFSLDLSYSYQHVFLYIRQLALNLRNAILNKKIENVQTVYNWQFINSLKLWGNLLAVTCQRPQLQQLIYPLIQICIGTMKLIPTPQYFPLRFHILQILIELSRDTGVFIPILPFILDILISYNFDKKHAKVSMKPLNFMCVFRLSKSQLQENGFKNATIDSIYALLLEYLASQSQSIAFPDLVLSSKLQLKAFIKKSKNRAYQSKMAQLVEKIDQNMEFINKERKQTTINLCDFKAIQAWETKVKNKGTPLNSFYENWDKVNKIKKSKMATNNDQIAEYNLPTIKKPKKKKKEDEGDVELFPSDSEEEETVLEKECPKKEVLKKSRGKRGSAKKNESNKVTDDVSMDIDTNADDIVQDFDVNDW